ncbi:PHP domain-containing protein [Salinicoccus halitifaciens]|uniref:Metal-dependent phosphoesterase TrpH n=1 Tax=Salinicoccus halitifaciens TaxID=1073415 RepID=A0ABV2ED16_9STAP|nr:PHP domain-containing protein [Salinicoccus halitifaciens]MCD2137410.1 PHP domain-containing protein [Salinicoccus halitifaciens]
MRVDLHVHSNHSDGADSLEAVIEKARRAGVTTLSFVDHDITGTYEAALPAAEAAGIRLIPGIEISAYDFKRGRKIHVLGYSYDPDALNIKELTGPLLARRHKHSLWQIERINRAGCKVDAETIAETAKPSRVIYKQHIMQYLTDNDYESGAYQHLYKSLFKGEGPASGDIEYIDARDALHAIRADGGLAVIAHPGQMDSYDFIEENIGLIDGIELLHPDHDADDHARIREIADRYGLALTGGSDYHGSFGTAVDVGVDAGMLRFERQLLGYS